MTHRLRGMEYGVIACAQATEWQFTGLQGRVFKPRQSQIFEPERVSPTRRAVGRALLQVVIRQGQLRDFSERDQRADEGKRVTGEFDFYANDLPRGEASPKPVGQQAIDRNNRLFNDELCRYRFRVNSPSSSSHSSLNSVALRIIRSESSPSAAVEPVD